MLTKEESERFHSKFIELPNGCHQWQGPLDKDGYGYFFLRRKSRRAHRVAWYMQRGGIPEGMVINHICRNRWCVNPQHMQLLTPRENNLQDSNSIPAINARKTHCKNGQEFDKVQTVKSGKSYRVCSICERDKARRLKAKWALTDELAGLI